MPKNPVPAWPRIEAHTRADGTGEVTINGTSHPVAASRDGDVIDAVLARVTETAAKIHRPVRMTTSGYDGLWRLIVHPDGHVEEDGPQPEQPPREEAPTPRPQPAAPTPPRAPQAAQTGLEQLLTEGRVDGSQAWTAAAETMASQRARRDGL